MYLLNTSTLALECFADNQVPPYAILSHRWEAEEVLYQDVQNGKASEKAGYKKVRGTCSLAKSHDFQYVWIDTCCIDKSSSAELSEAINSMYRWYQESTVCYVYLADVPPRSSNGDGCDDDSSGDDDEDDYTGTYGGFGCNWTTSAFRKSAWFTRGWTLQELLAPATVIFYNQTWTDIGTKLSLSAHLSIITEIPEAILRGTKSIDEVTIAERMSWAARRRTTRIEDIAYCLLGIFDINMPILYGEREKAFKRLQEEILKVTDDYSVFLWEHFDGLDVNYEHCSAGLGLACHPGEFETGAVFPTSDLGWSAASQFDGNAVYDKSIVVDNRGIHFKLPLFQSTSYKNQYLLLLPLSELDGQGQMVRIGLVLNRVGPGVYARMYYRSLGAGEVEECIPFREGDGTTCIKRLRMLRRNAQSYGAVWDCKQ